VLVSKIETFCVKRNSAQQVALCLLYSRHLTQAREGRCERNWCKRSRRVSCVKTLIKKESVFDAQRVCHQRISDELQVQTNNKTIGVHQGCSAKIRGFGTQFPHQTKSKTAPNSSNKVSIRLREFPLYVTSFDVHDWCWLTDWFFMSDWFNQMIDWSLMSIIDIIDVTNSNNYTTMLRCYTRDNLSFIHLCYSKRFK